MKLLQLGFLCGLFLQAPQQNLTGTIQGIVTRTGSREPLSGVLITLSNGILPATAGRLQFQSPVRPATSTQSMTTDQTGRFSFPALAPGFYSIRAARDGYLGGSVAEGLASETVTTTVTIDTAHLQNELTLSLTPGGLISGRVFATSGDPGANITVVAYKVQYLEDRMVLTSNYSRDTDDLGNYRLFWLPPGEYYIAAFPRASGPSPQKNPTYFPKTLDTRLAQTVRIGEGSEVGGIDIALQPLTDLKISGRVLRADGGSGNYKFVLIRQEADALLQNLEANLANVAKDPSGGRFELTGLMPGSYELYVKDISQQVAVAGHAHVEISGRSLSDVVIQAFPSVEVSGRFVLDGSPTAPRIEGTPKPMNIAGTPVTFPAINPLLVLQAADSTTIARSYRSSVDPTGSFLFRDVAPATYRLQAPGPFPGFGGLPERTYISDIRQLGQSVFDSGIVVDGGQAVPEVQVILRNDGGTVEGTVKSASGSSVIQASVILVPEASRRQNPLQFKHVGIDATGHFSFSDVKPGAYKVFAWSAETFPPFTPYRSSVFISKFEERGIPVIVNALTKAEVTVPLISAELKR